MVVKLPEGGENPVSPPYKAWVISITLFLSANHKNGLQKVWVKLICTFVEQVSLPWYMRVVNFFVKWNTEVSDSYRYCI